MKRLLKYFSIFACLVVALSSCDDDDLLSEYDTHKDEYTVYYNVTPVFRNEVTQIVCYGFRPIASNSLMTSSS